MPVIACALPVEDEPADEATSETEQSLLASNWSSPTQVSASTVWYAQVATVGGTTYMVHSGPGNGLKWRQLAGSVWTEPTSIPGQTSGTRVSLASFNGFLYMVRTELSAATHLAISKFTPSTGQWSASSQLPHTSYGGPPALAAYEGKLYFIGVDPGTKKLWMATMTADEALTPASPMDGHFSSSRVSAAVRACKLYIAHRAGTGTTVVYNSFDGTQWGWDQTIPAGPGGAAILATEVSIAERAGYLHLLHRDTSSSTVTPVWWTYFDGATWPSEISIGNASTYYPPVLTTGGPGLVALVTTYFDSLASSLQFTQPLPPRFPPIGCFIVKPPIG